MKLTTIDDEVLQIKRKDFKHLCDLADTQFDRAMQVLNFLDDAIEVDIKAFLIALDWAGFKLEKQTKKDTNVLHLAYFSCKGFVYKEKD